MSAALQRIREHEQRQQAARDKALFAAAWNRALSADEFKSLAEDGIPRTFGKPRRWWEFWKR